MVAGAFNEERGWALGQDPVDGNRDQADTRAICRILKDRVIPVYYKLSDDGIPHDWVKIMKQSIKSNATRFQARRMVKDDARKF